MHYFISHTYKLRKVGRYNYTHLINKEMEAQRIAKLATFTQLVNVQIQDSNLHAKMLGYSMHFFFHHR